MSKKKKASPVKAAKKNPVKKPAKKVVKPSAVKKASKPAKKVVVKKSVKPAPKKAVAKPVKKTAKPVKASKVKVVAKPKVVAKAPVKKAAKTVVKAKPVVPKATKKVIPKKPEPTAKTKKEPKSIPVTSKKIEAKAISKPLLNEEKSKKHEEPVNAKKQALERKAQEVLAINNTIPVKETPVISASKIASISNSITNPIKLPDTYSVRAEKEPAGKFEIEFVVHASADMLYEFISTASGLSEWFCDDVNIRNGIYTFIWEEQMQQARLLKTIDLQLVRFQWVDKTDGSYFEFRIQRDDLTNDISLLITDFAENASERESAKLLWHSQIEKLMHVIGSIF